MENLSVSFSPQLIKIYFLEKPDAPNSSHRLDFDFTSGLTFHTKSKVNRKTGKTGKTGKNRKKQEKTGKTGKKPRKNRKNRKNRRERERERERGRQREKGVSSGFSNCPHGLVPSQPHSEN